MLEFPESRVISAQMRNTLAGRKIVSVEVEQTPHRFAFFSDCKERYDALLRGQTVRGACGHGGIVELDTDELMLFFSDGAYPRYCAPGTPEPRKRQLLVRFDDGSALSVSVQMYGYIGLSAPALCEHAYYRSSADKPDALSAAFSLPYFLGLMPDGGAKLSVKGFLATEQRIPGLGNGVLQDILWNARLDPRRDVRTLSKDELAALYHWVRDTLSAMCAAGGRATECDFFGKPGGYAQRLCKDTLGTPCPRCGTPIEKAAYMGGAVYFCPLCQRR